MAKKRRQNGSDKKSGSCIKKKQVENEEKIVILPYNLEAEVNRIWLESLEIECNGDYPTTKNQPLGIQSLLDLLVAAHPETPVPLKRQVRMAKNVIPYQHIKVRTFDNSEKQQEDAEQQQQQQNIQNMDNDAEFCRFVQQMIEQRSNYKTAKRWDDVNEITERLQTLGVELDDAHKTWKIGLPVLNNAYEEEQDDDAAAVTDKTQGVACQMCGRLFGSKNLVFRHLRDPTSSCGNTILGRGESLKEAPSVVKKQAKLQREEQEEDQQQPNKKMSQSKRKRAPMTPQTGATTRHAPPEACVWMGDLPLSWTKPSAGQYKHLKAMLFRYAPPGTLPPWIKTVVRKGYRQSTNKAGQMHCENRASRDQHQEERDSYLGYAILVYRDAAEAKLVMEHMADLTVQVSTVYPMGDFAQTKKKTSATQQQHLSDFFVKIRSVESDGLYNQPYSGITTVAPKAAGLDPPILTQLLPLPMEELHRRYLRLCSHNASDNERYQHTWDGIASNRERRDLVAQAYMDHYYPRRCVYHQGKLIPNDLQAQLLTILQNLRWPAENHRAGLSAERYLVLTTSSQSAAFDDLKRACRRLMDWADANYFYSGIAVTKNFVASPHIDDRDQSFQYAVSLGNFTEGGELCVEGTQLPERRAGKTSKEDSIEFVNVVETKNRIARVDGRNVHWVRTWQGGDRYSLIFYDTSDRFPTPVLPGGIDLTYLTP